MTFFIIIYRQHLTSFSLNNNFNCFSHCEWNEGFNDVLQSLIVNTESLKIISGRTSYCKNEDTDAAQLNLLLINCSMPVHASHKGAKIHSHLLND